MKMFVITSLVLARFFFTIAAHPQYTTAPYLVVTQPGNDVCGYYSLDDATYTITCALGCAVATTTTPALKYCPGTGVEGDTPVTTQFCYGNWPADGCEPGQGCCTKSPQSLPSAGIFSFDGGKTVMLGCGLSEFTYAAFEVDSATLSHEATLTSTTLVVGTTRSPTGSAITSPSSSTSSAPTSSSDKTPAEKGLMAILGVVSGTSFIIFLYFLMRCYQLRRQKYTPVAQTHSGPSKASQPRGMDKWEKIAGIASPWIGLASLGATLYSALK